MGKKTFNFQKELEASIFDADPNQDRDELLTMIFKSYVAKSLEYTLRKKLNRIEQSAMETIRRNLISEFRKAELSEHQKSVEQYEDLFDTAIEEIFNDAAHAHGGQDAITVDKSLEINPQGYIENGGLILPSHLKN